MSTAMPDENKLKIGSDEAIYGDDTAEIRI